MVHIPEIELNFSNVCGANCYMCSKPHGCGNVPFMEPEVFYRLMKQLEDCTVGQFQTSGNGECLLNPHYTEYLMVLKNQFPDIERWCYNNFSLMNKEKTEMIVDGHLINKMHTRIESLDPEIFSKASRLNFETVMKNVEYFLEYNRGSIDPIPLVILYNNPQDYYEKCMRVLGKPPQYWPYNDRTEFPDEEQAIHTRLQPHSNAPINGFRISHCLWAERENCEPDPVAPCPKLPIIKNVTWVSPDGSIVGCCYDDQQSPFVLGNIMEEHIADIFTGQKRKDFITKIENREEKEYPCINPKCCNFDI